MSARGRPLPLVLTSASGEVVRRVPVARGDTVYEAITRAGVALRTSCRGSTICGQCGVRVLAGGEALPPAEADERALLDRHAPDAPDTRLACRLEVPAGVELVLATDYWSA